MSSTSSQSPNDGITHRGTDNSSTPPATTNAGSDSSRGPAAPEKAERSVSARNLSAHWESRADLPTLDELRKLISERIAWCWIHSQEDLDSIANMTRNEIDEKWCREVGYGIRSKRLDTFWLVHTIGHCFDMSNASGKKVEWTKFEEQYEKMWKQVSDVGWEGLDDNGVSLNQQQLERICDKLRAITDDSHFSQ